MILSIEIYFEKYELSNQRRITTFGVKTGMFPDNQVKRTFTGALRTQGAQSSAHMVLSTLQWRHSGHNWVSNHQFYDCLLNLFFRRRLKKTSTLRVTGLCEGNSPVTGKFPAQRASNAENASIWWRHHVGNINHCLRHWGICKYMAYLSMYLYSERHGLIAQNSTHLANIYYVMYRIFPMRLRLSLSRGENAISGTKANGIDKCVWL